MTKSKKFIVTVNVLVLLLLCIAVGVLFMRTNNSESQKPQILNYYSGNYFGEKQELIDKLNNNEIDKKFALKLENAVTPADEAAVVGEWINFYDDCLEKMYSQLENYVNSDEYKELSENAGEYSIDTKKIENFRKAVSKYESEKSSFFEDFHMTATGYGTGASATLGFYTLNEERTLLFELIELTDGFISVDFFEN